MARRGETLSPEYIAAREAAGYGRYISPDKKVDASTCRFPEYTHFVANLDHSWPGKYAGLELQMVHPIDENGTPELTLPQFLWWDAEKQELVPLESVISPDEEPAQPGGIRGFFVRIRNFFADLWAKITAFFGQIGG